MNFQSYSSTIIWFLIPLPLLLTSCSMIKWTVPEEMTGQWETEKTKITVRTEPKWKKCEFTSDSAGITFIINEDKTASGSIGSAKFKNVKIKRNQGNPDITGIAYIIKCGWIGKIFPDDPVDSKEVEIWLGPLKEGEMNAELRFTEGLAVFPMAGMKLSKVKE